MLLPEQTGGSCAFDAFLLVQLQDESSSDSEAKGREGTQRSLTGYACTDSCFFSLWQVIELVPSLAL